MAIKFFTTSTLTDVQEIQSELIKQNFPSSEHILIDGRGGWFAIWYRFLEYELDTDYIIHLDELTK